MLVKMGVHVSDLERPIRRALSKIDWVFLENAKQEAVITSTNEGTHSPSSLHYANLAVDIRLPKDDVKKTLGVLKEVLGPSYDVILEASHFHIEYDPK